MGEYGSQTDILEQRGERGFRKKLKRKWKKRGPVVSSFAKDVRINTGNCSGEVKYLSLEWVLVSYLRYRYFILYIF